MTPIPIPQPQFYACARNHKVYAENSGAAVDLSGYYCPLCMGAIKRAGEMVDPFILAPVQEV